jgi:hypothetical protein
MRTISVPAWPERIFYLFMLIDASDDGSILE